MRTLQLAWWCATAICSAGGCALGEGRGFGHLSAQLGAAFAALGNSERQTADGWVRAAETYELHFSRLELTLAAVEVLRDASTSPVGDEADDHEQHDAHDDHGAAAKPPQDPKPDAEVDATVVAQWPGPITFDLLPAEAPPRELDECRPTGCEVGLAVLQRVRIELGQLRGAGRVRDARPEPRVPAGLSFELELDLEGVHLDLLLTPAVRVAPDAPPEVGLTLTLALPAPLFDQIQWHALERTAAGAVSDALRSTGPGAAVRAAAGTAAIAADVTR